MILFRNTLLMTKELKMRYGCQFWRSGYQINNYTILTTCSNLPKQMIYYSYTWSYKNYDANRWNLDMHGLSQTISKMSARIGINQLNILMGVGWISSHAVNYIQDDVIKWKHFPRYWPLVRGIHRSPVNSPHKGQWRGALIFSLICVWINGWVNNGEAGDFRRYRAHYDVTIISKKPVCSVWFIQTKEWYCDESSVTVMMCLK